MAEPIVVSGAPLSDDELDLMDKYWRASNYLSVGQIYLMDNPLLREPLKPEHVKPRLLGHWGTSPGQNILYVHLNRVIKQRDIDTIFISGPGHGGPSLVSHTYLEGTYSEYYPSISRDTEGMRKLFKQFSFPGGIPSHVAPETPGSIHEGGELGYSISHAYGAAFDNPDLIVTAVVGDGEAESGPLAASWHSNKWLNPITDGAVLPILHLNGYKIANPVMMDRMPMDELCDLMVGYGYKPYLIDVWDNDDTSVSDDHPAAHQKIAATFDAVFAEIAEIQRNARENNDATRPLWPMIIFHSPKGWTGPKYIDGKKTEGHWRSHQVPLAETRENKEHRQDLEKWLKSYKPEELFDDNGTLLPEIQALAPEGHKRMGDQPHTNGGAISKALRLPDWRQYGLEVERPGHVEGEATRVLGNFLRDVMKANSDHANFRVFAPDENSSNRFNAIYAESPRRWVAEYNDDPEDNEDLSPDGRVMEILSEHTIEGWLEGYLLTGRHGFFSTYEAFVHVIDSMFNQHAKWLRTTNHIGWRAPIPSLNLLLTSHVWRQDHNGFSHQDPGFIDHVVNKKAEVVRVYLPPDANTLLSVANHCLRSKQYVNVIVAGKQPALQYLTVEQSIRHCTKGIGIWDWASNDEGEEPDLIMACAGDIPTMEALAATSIIRKNLPEVKIRFINVVDLMRLQPAEEHPHGLSEKEFDALFTSDTPIIFDFHGYPWLIHRLTYRRNGHDNLHVRGYKEEGTTTTPFDMAVLNQIDRFNLVIDAIDRLPMLGDRASHLRQQMKDKLIDHKVYVAEHGDDMPEIKEWTWDL
jgi:xylulose-5-phosphate/fructose-6-phosphate phosphoketolase